MTSPAKTTLAELEKQLLDARANIAALEGVLENRIHSPFSINAVGVSLAVVTHNVKTYHYEPYPGRANLLHEIKKAIQAELLAARSREEGLRFTIRQRLKELS